MPGACAGATQSLRNNGIQTGLSAPTNTGHPASGRSSTVRRRSDARKINQIKITRQLGGAVSNTKLHLGQKLFIIDVFYCQ